MLINLIIDLMFKKKLIPIPNLIIFIFNRKFNTFKEKNKIKIPYNKIKMHKI